MNSGSDGTRGIGILVFGLGLSSLIRNALIAARLVSSPAFRATPGGRSVRMPSTLMSVPEVTL